MTAALNEILDEREGGAPVMNGESSEASEARLYGEVLVGTPVARWLPCP